MKGELKRALLKKSNIILIVFVITLMLANAYYSGWNTSLLINSADDLLNSEDVIFFQKYFGNVYRVWSKSYYMIQALAPLILVAPYLTSYTLEKNNHYRYFMISRKGLFKYNFHKLFAIALSGTIILGGAELLFGIITYFFTHHDNTLEFLNEIVFFNDGFFYENPLLYFILVYLSHIIYYFSFLFFATGITSFLRNKIAVIITPFLLIGLLDMVLPLNFQPNVIMQPHYSSNFNFISYGIMILAYIAFGIISLFVSEKINGKRGT